MKTYSTYQEAKIENPECEVAVVARTDEFTPSLGDFISVLRADELLDGYSFADKSKPGCPNISDGYYKICDPADYCMTVEQFLKDGHKFEIGDIVLDYDDAININTDGSVFIYNSLDLNHDKNRYILSAAALEKPKRTKVEFVKVEESIFDLKDDFEAGELFCRLKLVDEVSFHVIESVSSLLIAASDWDIYRRVETQMTEEEALAEALKEIWIIDGGDGEMQIERIVNSGKFKLVN